MSRQQKRRRQLHSGLSGHFRKQVRKCPKIREQNDSFHDWHRVVSKYPEKKRKDFIILPKRMGIIWEYSPLSSSAVVP